MCNHAYTSDYSKSHGAIGIKCPYTALFSQVSPTTRDLGPALRFDSQIPLDPTGACLFHSNLVAWKKENNSWSRFIQLVGILNTQENGPNCFDFAEFIFVTDDSEASVSEKGDPTLRLLDLTFQKEPIFSGASFLDSVDFCNVNFPKGVTFRGATFHRQLTFERSRLGGADFACSFFKSKTSFKQTSFESYALFGSAQFSGSKVIFEQSTFDGISDFSTAVFALEGTGNFVRFKDVQFRDVLDFTGASFTGQVIFENVSFGFSTEFVDTLFYMTESAGRYRGAAVEFRQVEILEDANLNFKSTNASRKLFNHNVLFSFKGEPQGIIRFENVNFHEIETSSRKRLTDLTKHGKVEIGSGCIKYRFQSAIKTILIGLDNAPLILEIARIFANYFTVQHGINLGLEVTERTAAHVAFFYFTDEDIQDEEFFARLQRTEQDLWNLLAINPDVFHLLDGSVESLTTTPQNAIINAVDGVSALIGTCFRVGIRIAIGRWRENDTRSLLEAIRFNSDSVEGRAASLHKVILGQYTGRNLAGISRTQNEGLPAIDPVGRNLLTGYAGESGDGLVQTSKVTILFLGANGETTPLQLEREVSAIQNNLKLAKERDHLILRQEWAVTIDTLMQSILDESPNMIHFSGHGEHSGILLQDPIGNPTLVTNNALEKLFKLFKDTITCVVLNSCYSEHQAKAIRTHIPYVVGVRSGIPDLAAIAFSTGFYKGIGAGRGVPFAFELGKVAMELWGVAGEGATVLL